MSYVLPHCGQVFWGAGVDNDAWVWEERPTGGGGDSYKI